jgi:DNA-binding response OmpR family regulator
MRVLLVGAYRPLVKALRRGLEEEGFTVDVAGDAAVPTADYGAIILDLRRARDAGLSPVRDWRLAGLKAHVLALTVPEDNEEQIPGLSSVADDSLTKPFELDELIRRLQALLPRSPERVRA